MAVEVMPTTPALTDTFLHVLSLADASVLCRTRCHSHRCHGNVGAEVSNRVVLFSKTGALVNDVTYPVWSSGPVHHLRPA
jgi:hypothetical protein